MYRRDYPDVPGMFDARFREYNRSNVYREFQASWFISIVGGVMVTIGCGILFWNEGRAVKIAISLDEGLRDVTVPETLDVVFDENNGKLVLVSGNLNIADPLTDSDFGISINSVKLRRVVQVYQWYETEDQHESNVETAEHDSHRQRTYSYNTDWFEYHIESLSFYNTLGHHNPHRDQWPLNSSVATNPRVKIGNFLLGTDVKEKFTDYKPFNSGKKPSIEGIKIYAGLYYHSANVWKPEVGDYRVQFTYAGRHDEEYTAVGRQSGREIRPYMTELGEELLILHPGVKTAADVFRTEHNNNRTATWIYRLGGWFLAFLGFSCMSLLLETMMDQYPLARQMLAIGIAPIQFTASITATLGTIGLGWVWYRPLVGGALVGIALAPYIVPAIKIAYRRGTDRDRYRLS